MKKYIIVISCIVLCLAILFSAVYFSNIIPNSANSLKGKSYSIKNSMISYLLLEKKKEYINAEKLTLGDNYESVIGLDISKAMRGKDSPYGVSWFNYFYNSAISDAKDILLKCEAASQKKITLSDSDLKAINKKLAKIKHKDYGITEENLKKLLEMQRLAEKYDEDIIASISQKDYDAYEKKNINFYSCVDYKYINVTIDDDRDIKAAKAVAESLLSDIKARGFDAAANDYLTKEGISKTLSDLTKIGVTYQNGTKLSEWAFDSERKAEDCIIIEGEKQHTIYYITKAAYPFDYQTIFGQISRKKRGVGKYSFSQLTDMLEKVEDDKGFYDFSNKCGFSLVNDGVIFNENLPENVLDWLFGSDVKQNDSILLEYGDYVYALRFEGQAGSYYQAMLKQNYNKTVMEKQLKELRSKYEIKQSDFFKFLIKDKI